jgi:hypothetical protein
MCGGTNIRSDFQDWCADLSDSLSIEIGDSAEDPTGPVESVAVDHCAAKLKSLFG